MRVTAAEVLHVRAPLTVAAGPAGVFNRHRETLLLKLSTSDGTVGWGETYALPGTRDLLAMLAADLVGAPVTHAWPRRPGLDEVGAALALSAVDIAWHDLLGRTLGVPVHTLLGGARRDRVPAYASGFLYQEGRHPADAWPDEAARLHERGFRAMKVRMGGYPPVEELALLEQLRATLPGDVMLMVDAWGAYSAPTAVRVGRRLADLGVAWFEEPTPLARPELTAQLAVPVAGGEMGRTPSEFARLLDHRTFDVIQPDAAICGGLAAARFVGELAALHEIACVPHTWNGAVMAAATLHLAAVLPPAARTGDGTWPGGDVSGPMLEYDTSENPFIRDILRVPPSLVDGCFAVPDSPGLGIEIDETTLSQYRIA
ncbi:mandelate racemase/muconate lactonizing enzyme family protein [Dactylosporangium sp. NPDC049742]|uniref:mandelate racemase/muconate lactonizing enzyme family protein n=1 Tax=Dactylosporangium sp. NPDC049742 TaxID=3154737 RepID=UPI003436ABA5